MSESIIPARSVQTPAGTVESHPHLLYESFYKGVCVWNIIKSIFHPGEIFIATGRKAIQDHIHQGQQPSRLIRIV